MRAMKEKGWKKKNIKRTERARMQVKLMISSSNNIKLGTWIDRKMLRWNLLKLAIGIRWPQLSFLLKRVKTSYQANTVVTVTDQLKCSNEMYSFSDVIYFFSLPPSSSINLFLFLFSALWLTKMKLIYNLLYLKFGEIITQKKDEKK